MATFVIMQTDDAMGAQYTHNLHSFMKTSCAFVNLYHNFQIAQPMHPKMTTLVIMQTKDAMLNL